MAKSLRIGGSTRFDHDGALTEINDCLRFALNELRALDAGEGNFHDQMRCAERLGVLSEWIAAGRIPPDANAIINEASRIPIQV